ncbi:MAG: hypothetical protein SGILL_009102 [Bacillariaceae sp.]
MLAVRNYIIAKDDINPYSVEGKNLSKDIILVDLTHSNLVQKHVEIRFHDHDTIQDVKARIHQKTGTPPHFQQLILKSAGQVMMELPAQTELDTGNDGKNMDHYKLGYFFATTGGDASSSFYLPAISIHCVDVNPLSDSRGGQYEDVSLVQKFSLTDKEYRERDNTLHSWASEQKAKNPNFSLAKHAKEHADLVEAKRQHKLGLPLPKGFVVDSTGAVVKDEPDYDETVAMKKLALNENGDAVAAAETEFGSESVAHIAVDQRCQVEPGKRRGKVAYVGPVVELDANPESMWVGVIFDEPVGRTDGSVAAKSGGEKKRYFQANLNCGGFVRGKNVQVGDFPERDIMDELESSDDEDEL